jgi:hypothetical protein
MPRYYFRLIKDNEVVKIPEGIDLPGNAAAREEAVTLARGLKAGKIQPGRKWDGWQVTVVSQHGRVVDSVPIDVVPQDPARTGI